MGIACISDSGRGVCPPPRGRPPLLGNPPRGRPPEGSWDQVARQEVIQVILYGEPPMKIMTDASENITLPQTSFAGGNNP